MPRLAALRPALLALALLSSGACSPSGGAPDAGAPAAAPLTPVPAPAGLLGDLFIPSPGATWGRARASAGGPAVFMPQSFGGLAATVVGLPITMSAEIDDAVPLVGAAVREGKGPIQGVVGLHVKAGDRFVDQLTRGEGARFNGSVDAASHVTLLTDKITPEASRFALGVLGNYLLVAQKPADLYAVGPYVVRTLSVAPQPKEEIAVELPEGALAGPVLEAARELRASSDGAVATLVPLTGLLDHAIELLGDARHARITFTLDPSAVHARVVVAPKPGAGPGARLVSELAVGDARPLLDLPDATSLGLFWRESAAARVENAPKQAEALAGLLGKEVTAADREAISVALRGEAAARGDWQAVGVAFNGTGPSAVVRAPVSDVEAMRRSLKQLVDVGGSASFKKMLADRGLRLASDKAVVENLAADVIRVRLSRTDGDDAGDPRGKPEKGKLDPKGKLDKGKKAPEPPPGKEAPKAVDLLYFVDKDGLFAAAGFDPRDSLRALVKAPSGGNLAGNAPMASALAAVGADAAFVLIADALRINAMTTGTAAPSSATPLVLAAGRTAAPAELWGRLDLPVPVLQMLITDYTRSRSAMPAPAPAQ
jgi:hypothetical protein